jgi:signal transduction histidine kinase
MVATTAQQAPSDVQALMDALGIPALAVDADGTVTATNAPCREVFQDALQPGVALARVVVGLDLTGLRRRRMPDLEVVLVHTGGAPVTVRITLLPLRDDTHSVLLLERRAEPAEVSRRRTLDRIHTVARTISTMRHELAGTVQTLMNGPFIVRRALARTPEEALKQLDTMDQQIQVLIDKLKSFDRLPLSLRDPDARAVEIAELVRVLTETRPRVRSQVDVLDADRIWGDHAQLVLALGALLDNALECSSPQASVLLTVSRDDEHVTFSIDDDGHTAWTPAPESIFDPFYTSKHKNLGVGLCIAYAVAARHAADLVVGARPSGTGTRATLTFTRHAATSRGAEAGNTGPQPEPGSS